MIKTHGGLPEYRIFTGSLLIIYQCLIRQPGTCSGYVFSSLCNESSKLEYY